MIRIFDFLFSLIGLIFLLPLIILIFFIGLFDNESPLFIQNRVGYNLKSFSLIKFRTMPMGVRSAGTHLIKDIKLSSFQNFLRTTKIDEIPQLWNVLIGDMSLVGPRPIVLADANLYTDVERKLFSVKPGITDFSSIVFSDEGKILENKKDPNLAYNQLIRPWKSRMGLIYIEKRTLVLDLQIILYTVIALFSKQRACNWVSEKLNKFNVEANIVKVAKRKDDLFPFFPPGSYNE